jgi:glutathione S-transferase
MVTDLWHFPFSHFNEKVRWALDHKGWPHRRHALAPGFHVPRALRLTGQTATPILRVDGRVLHDSTRIIAFIEAERRDPPLYPESAKERERALEVEDHFDEHVGDEVRRFFYDCYARDPRSCASMSTVDTSGRTRRAYQLMMPIMRRVLHLKMDLSEERAVRARHLLPSFFDEVARRRSPSGYLVGSTFTIADLTAAAMLSIIVAPEQFPYALPEPIPEPLLEMRQRLANHEGFLWVREIYARHRPPNAARS